MTNFLNAYANIFTPTILNTITPNTWINLIKNSEYIEKIEEARQYKQLYLTTGNKIIKTEYDKIKNSLPAVTWNATFDTTKSNATFIKGTGYLFIDIDHTDFKIEMIDKSKTYLINKSIGGLGYSIVVKCHNINLCNFDSTYQFIVAELNIEKYVDFAAKKITQYSILSYDLDVYVNEDSYIYNSVSPSSIIINNNFVPTAALIKEKEEHNAAVGTKSNARYNNLNDFNFNGKDYIEDWTNGLDYIFCSLPFVPLKDGRKRYMINYIRNYVYLNPEVSELQIINNAKFVNLKIGVEPLSATVITGQVKTIIQQLKAGTLTPKIKKRKILFSSASLMTKDEKEKLKGERQSLFNNENTTSLMYDVIENWNFELNGKITIRSVAIILTASNTTIAKYWKNIKSYVADLNAASAEDIKLYRQQQKNINDSIQENDITVVMEDMQPGVLLEQAYINNPDTFDVEFDDDDYDFLNLH